MILSYVCLSVGENVYFGAHGPCCNVVFLAGDFLLISSHTFALSKVKFLTDYVKSCNSLSTLFACVAQNELDALLQLTALQLNVAF